MVIENKLTDEVMKAIEQLQEKFKDALKPEVYEDVHFFRRFLAAREYNVDKAEAMIRKHLEWMEKYDVENVMATYKMPEVIVKYVPYLTIAYDKEGCPVRFTNVGNIDINGLMSSVKFEDFIKTTIFEIGVALEDLKKQSNKLKKDVEKVVGIMDLQNLRFSHVSDKRAIQIFLHLLRLCMNNYPGRLKGVYMLNVSFYFSFVYTLMKSVLPASVLEKIHIYSDDSFKEDLLEIIDADALPAFLGGNKTDPDGNPLCLTFGIVHEPEPVPESYYIRKGKRALSKLPDVKKATLSRANFLEIKLDVKEPGSYLEWEFETKCRDVGFGLFYEEIVDGEEKITELVPIQRLDTEEYPETGTIKCDNTGTYVIVFDNTYSWIRGKEIYYRSKIITPKEHEAEMKD